MTGFGFFVCIRSFLFASCLFCLHPIFFVCILSFLFALSFLFVSDLFCLHPIFFVCILSFLFASYLFCLHPIFFVCILSFLFASYLFCLQQTIFYCIDLVGHSVAPDNKFSCEREVTLAPGQSLSRSSSLSQVHVNRPLESK